MPIEFRCHTCNRLLRTPDESAGRQAKCPQCSAVLTVPVGSADEATSPISAPAPPAKPEADNNPFGAQAGSPVVDQSNPYASPTTFPVQPVPDVVGTDGLVPTIIQFANVFRDAWKVFTNRFGICVLFGLICICIHIGSTVINLPLQFVPLMAGNEPVAIIASFITQIGVNILFQALISCLMVMFGLLVLRGNRAPLSNIWKLGPHFLPVALGNLLLTVGTYIAIAICAVPIGLLIASGEEALQIAGVIVDVAVDCLLLIGYFYFLLCATLTFHLVVDRRLGLFDAARTSMQFMRGNKLSAFLIFLVIFLPLIMLLLTVAFLAFAMVMILNSALVSVGLGLGVIVAFVTFGGISVGLIPFSALLWTTIYLKATGQPVMTA